MGPGHKTILHRDAIFIRWFKSFLTRLFLHKMTPAVQYQLDYYTAADRATGTKMQLSFAC